MPFLDVREIGFVVAGHVDRVVRQVVVAALNSQIKHIGRAGIKRLFASLRSVQRRRRASGTSFVIAWAKSALTTTASGALLATGRARTPTALRPSKRISSTGSARRMSTPISSATRAMARVTAPQPPVGCQTPYSYSRKESIENRLGQLNGDMPRYFDWNEKARRTLGSRK